VELLVAEVLQSRSVSLARTDDNITELAALRRVDGSSVCIAIPPRRGHTRLTNSAS
jgi:hypothetical protein